MPPNPLVEEEPTWLPVADAARWAGVSPSTVNAACRSGRLPYRTEGRTRLVPLETVLVRLGSRDLDALRSRIETAMTAADVPESVRDWVDFLRSVLVPVLDELRATRARAIRAEAQLELVSRQRPPIARN